jgi:HAD superfamily hydrolase (TIGR01509 family)
MKDIAVVLDIDGLMVDTEPISRLAWDRVLERYGRILDDDLHTRIIGYRIDESVIMIIDEYDIPASPAEIKQLKKVEYDQILAHGVPVMPGLYDLVAAINRNGLPWAVATSSPHAHAQEILQQLELSDSCAAIAGGDEVPHGKPAPDIYLLAAKRLGIPPQNCLALEDSPPGCRAALAAGMMTLAIPNGDTQKADFPQVHKVFKSLSAVSQELDLLLLELRNR